MEMEIVMKTLLIKDLIYAFIFLGLILETVTDIREKRIWLPILVMEVPILLGLNYMIGKGNMLLWIASIGFGAFFYLISIITRGQLGKGDALLFCVTGAGIGLWNNIMVIYLTFFLAFLGAVFFLVIKKTGKKYCMPLAPFVLASYTIVFLAEQFGS